MTEILTFVFTCFSSIFDSMRHFSLQSGGFPSFFDLCIALVFFRVVVFVIHFIQDVDEVESVPEYSVSSNEKQYPTNFQAHHIRRR